MKLLLPLAVLLHLSAGGVPAQTLNVPPRPAGAPTGSQFINIITPMSLTERENWIYAQVISGNVPNFLRTLVPITVSATINGTPHTATYYAAPDYLAIGTDADYFLEPMSPLLAQRICDRLGCTLPTRRMVGQIWSNAPVKLAPFPYNPNNYDILSIAVFALSNGSIRSQRQSNSLPLGALVSGDKKDVVISTMIYSNLHSGLKPVVIFGWYQLAPFYGEPIQPLYNGHEQTYADYSHGIRLIQNAMTVDGTANTVTNVLTNPNLAALLSDEGPSEGTTANGVIQVPRYTVAAVAPVVIAHPRSQTVLPGASAVIAALAVGDLPLTYVWQFNGAPLAGATGSSLSLSNIQSAKAGSYNVVVTNPAGSATSRAALLHVNTNVHPVLFADAFESDTSANWNIFWGAANGIADYTADWAFGYGAIPFTFNGVTALIPPAPNSPDTSSSGVRLTVNNNDTTAATAAVNVYPEGQSFSGNFALKFDMWINYPGNAGGAGSTGSTEFAIFGLDHLGTQVNWAAPSAASSDGIWFGVDGDGGTASSDYRAYLGNLGGTQTDLTGTGSSGLVAVSHTAAIYQTLFPAARCETAGTPGKNWVEAELRQTNGVIVWILNGTVAAIRTNTSVFTSGNVMLGYMDPFSSIANPAEDAFVLYDNVRVEDLSGPALQAPAITSQPASQSVVAGSDVSLTVGASGSSPLAYQWRRNGTNLPGATASSLPLSNVQAASAGSYDALVSNAAGFAASAQATLSVNAPQAPVLSASTLAGGQAELSFYGVAGQSYLIQASTNLVTWQALAVLPGTNAPLSFIDPDSTNLSRRFYRAAQSPTQTLTDFEGYAPGTMVLFQKPQYSGSTSNLLNSAPNLLYVTNAFPSGHASAQVLYVSWGFKSSASNPWLRLTTFGATNLANPTISTNQVLQFDIETDTDLYAAIGFRETSTTVAIGADGGTGGTIEWIGGITDNTTTPPKGHFVHAGQWATLSFFLPTEPVHAFTGNGILQTTTGKGVLEHLAFVPAGASGATYNVFLDNFQVIDLAP